MDKIIESLDKNAEKLFQWFQNNFLKANFEKYHFLTNNSEKTAISIRSEKIWRSSSQKLLEYLLLLSSFDELYKILCRKASQKLNALSRVAHYKNLRMH